MNSTSIKFVRGIAAYLVAAAGTLFRYECPDVAVSGGSSDYRGRMTILAVHNGVTTGGGFRLTPAARPDDGRLDALLVEATGVPVRLARLVAAIRGTLPRKPGSHELSFTTLRLDTSVALPCHFDGNPGSIEPPGMTFEVLPAAQEVVSK